MRFKRTAAVLCSALLAVCSITALPAFAVTTGYVIDNDPLASTGYTASSYNFTYYSFSGSYNGDARRASSSTQARYSWVHPITTFNSQNVHYQLQAYLNHSTFTDPAAQYTFEVDGTMSTDSIVINQNKAPSGFGNTYTMTTKANLIREIRLNTSGTPNCYTGADAISIKYTYTP